MHWYIFSFLWVNILRPRQNGRRFADDTFKRIFLNQNVSISIKISLKFVPKGPINNIPPLVQIMAWRCPGDKPLSEPMMVSLLTHVCVTWPQWVNILWPSDAILHQRSWLVLVQVMAHHMLFAKPLSEPMLLYCLLDQTEQTLMEFEWRYDHFPSQTCIWKYCHQSRGLYPSMYVFLGGLIELWYLLILDPGIFAHFWTHVEYWPIF